MLYSVSSYNKECFNSMKLKDPEAFREYILRTSSESFLEFLIENCVLKIDKTDINKYGDVDVRVCLDITALNRIYNK